MPTVRRPFLLLLALLAVVLVATGCGSSSGSGDADPAKAVPASSLFYGAVQIRPEGDAKSGVEAAGRKILNGKDVGAELQRAFDRSSRRDDVTYEDDIEPWLGRRVAVAVTGIGAGKPDVLVIANSTDDGKARDALAKGEKKNTTQKSYRGVDYRLDRDGQAAGVTDGWVMLGTTQAAFKAGVDTLKGGQSLAGSSAYKNATSKVDTGALGLLYVDTRRFIDVIAQANPEGAAVLSQLRTLPQFADLEPRAADITADGDAVRVETPAPDDASSQAADTVAKLPASSWLAFAAPRAGKSLRTQLGTLSGQQRQQFEQVKRLLRQQTGLDLDRDVLGWIQGVSVFATGTTLPDLKAGLVLDSSDPAASRRALAKLARLAGRRSGSQVRKTADGFEVRSSGLPAPVTFAVAGRRVVIAYGNRPQAALTSGATLAGSPTYAEAQKALGGGRPAFLVSMPTILQLAENLGATNDSDYSRARPYLKAFGAITAGLVDDGGRRLSRFAVGLR